MVTETDSLRLSALSAIEAMGSVNSVDGVELDADDFAEEVQPVFKLEDVVNRVEAMLEEQLLQLNRKVSSLSDSMSKVAESTEATSLATKQERAGSYPIYQFARKSMAKTVATEGEVESFVLTQPQSGRLSRRVSKQRI